MCTTHLLFGFFYLCDVRCVCEQMQYMQAHPQAVVQAIVHHSAPTALSALTSTLLTPNSPAPHPTPSSSSSAAALQPSPFKQETDVAPTLTSLPSAADTSAPSALELAHTAPSPAALALATTSPLTSPSQPTSLVPPTADI